LIAGSRRLPGLAAPKIRRDHEAAGVSGALITTRAGDSGALIMIDPRGGPQTIVDALADQE